MKERNEAADRIDCCCMQRVGLVDDEPVLIPLSDCDLHWRQVIDAELPPAQMFP